MPMCRKDEPGVDDALAQKIEFVISGKDQVGIRRRTGKRPLKNVDGAQDVDCSCDGIVDPKHVLRNSFWGVEMPPFKGTGCPKQRLSKSNDNSIAAP